MDTLLGHLSPALLPTMRRLAALVGALATLVVGPPAVAAEALHVTRGDDPPPGQCKPGDCSLREAVIAADNHGGHDTIRLPAGTIKLTLPVPAGGDFGFPQVGDLDLTDDVTIIGPGRSARERSGPAGDGLHATIDGNGATTNDRVFEIDGSGTAVTLRRLRITGGDAQKTDDANGDGIPDFARGGAVRTNKGARLDLDRDLLVANKADSYGQGGAVYNAGQLHVSDSALRLNTSTDGFSGAIQTEPGATTDLSHTTIEANEATFGGGLGAYGLTTVEDSSLLANHAGVGGAIRAGGGSSLTTLNDSTIAHNDATGDGSAIRARDGAGLFLNAVTIARNRADADGSFGGGNAAISLRRDTLATSAKLTNTILAADEDGSPGPGDVPECEVSGGAALILAGYDLLGDRAGCSFTVPLGTQGNQVPSTGETLDPELALASASNGGPTSTLALLPASPALDAGSPDPAGPAPACPTADQRGAPRGRCDIGAYELDRCAGRIVNVVGTPGSDFLVGSPRADGVLGLDGADTISGRRGNDRLCAGRGRDQASGGRGADRLLGGRGSDTLDGGRGIDACRGGRGRDRLLRCEHR